MSRPPGGALARRRLCGTIFGCRDGRQPRPADAAPAGGVRGPALGRPGQGCPSGTTAGARTRVRLSGGGPGKVRPNPAPHLLCRRGRWRNRPSLIPPVSPGPSRARVRSLPLRRGGRREAQRARTEIAAAGRRDAGDKILGAGAPASRAPLGLRAEVLGSSPRMTRATPTSGRKDRENNGSCPPPGPGLGAGERHSPCEQPRDRLHRSSSEEAIGLDRGSEAPRGGSVVPEPVPDRRRRAGPPGPRR